MSEPTLYIIKPQAIIRDKRLTASEADFLCLIAQLQNAKGCTATNQYFANYFCVVRNNAARTISALKRKGFIRTVEKKSGGKTIERTITIIDADSIKLLLSNSIETIPSDSIKCASGLVSNARTIHKRETEEYTYVLKNQNQWSLTPEKLQEYLETFTGIDVAQELRKASQWLKDNPAKRKTAAGMPRYLTGWLGRAKPSNGTTSAAKSFDIDDLPGPDYGTLLAKNFGWSEADIARARAEGAI